MAAKQRGGKSRSFKPAKGSEKMKEFRLSLECSDDDDDDAAPEEVTFERSKAAALRSIKRALKSDRREKELLKEKRRKRQELFQEQKKKKLLSAEVLEEMDSAPLPKWEQSDEKADDDKEETQEDGELVKKTARRHIRSLKGKYTVKIVKESTTAAFQLRAAEDFIRSRLYGAGCGRTTSNELLSLQNKTGNHSAAVQFVKKDWGHKQKAKAEKLKKRWVHKQQNPESC